MSKDPSCSPYSSLTLSGLHNLVTISYATSVDPDQNGGDLHAIGSGVPHCLLLISTNFSANLKKAQKVGSSGVHFLTGVRGHPNSESSSLELGPEWPVHYVTSRSGEQ